MLGKAGKYVSMEKGPSMDNAASITASALLLMTTAAVAELVDLPGVSGV